MTDKRMVLTVVAGLAIAGVFVILLATKPGVGVVPDSTVYFDAARNLANGRGFVVISGTASEFTPLVHYPPLYSSLLALALNGGVTLETAARWLNASLFGANIFLVGYAIAFSVGKSFWLPVLGALLTLTAPDLLAIHSVAMTEPLYLALTLGGLLLLARYLQNGRRSLLVMAAILIALSCLTRYVGVATIASALIGIMLLQRTENAAVGFAFSFRSESMRRRILDAVIFATLCGLPVVTWSIRNRLAGGTPDRHLAFHPVTLQQVVPAFSTAAQWLLLGKVRNDLRVVAFVIEILALASLTIFLLSKRTQDQGDRREQPTKLPQLLVIFIVAYGALLLITITFVEMDIVLDSRSLLPIHCAALVLGTCLAKMFYRRASQSRWIQIVLVALAFLFAGSYTLRGGRWLARVQADGQGFVSRAWQESPTMAEIRKLPAGIPIYTNGIDAVYYLSGRRALDIPPRIIHGTGRPNEQYESELSRMNDDLRAQKGVLVYFRALPERWFLPSEDELRSRLSLQVRTFNDGSILENYK
jgi:hypothetical protein